MNALITSSWRNSAWKRTSWRSACAACLKAIADFNMIEAGERVASASRGKDSYGLLDVLSCCARARPSVRHVAVNLDQKHPGFPAYPPDY
jgi:hypothetical protein